MMPTSLSTPIDEATFYRRAHKHLNMLYGPRADEVLRRLLTLLSHQAPDTIDRDYPPAPLWSERDQWLISYGDSLIADDTTPLEVLDDFLARRLGNTISGVHLLPFFPWSSDDGLNRTGFLGDSLV